MSTVTKATGMSRTTIYAGHADLKMALPTGSQQGSPRIRVAGGGRKKLTAKDSNLLRDLDAPVESTLLGDSMSPLRWTCKSTHRLAEVLKGRGHGISQRTVCDLLSQMDYCLQTTRNTRAGKQHEVRDAQFLFIAQSVSESELGMVAPYRVYDVTANTGWVNIGIDHDTAEFAVQSIRRWWRKMGQANYPRARRLLITADCGGSNGCRVRLWCREFQKLANEPKLTIQVCHFPPGTSKWNKIEHRMFCHTTANWRGRLLVSRQVIVNLIGGTTTRCDLRINAGIDENTCARGIKISDEEHAALAIECDAFHDEWNYRLPP